ncbi:MAG: hypothetical protein V7L20_19970 [Nostoc sp.]|uniref:hypothetical protein n=1 Tax=Nostoc sp. TaxID=1180 RepID=UPI002FF9BBBA
MKTNLRIREAVTTGLMVSGVALLSPSVALSQSATPGNITGQWSGFSNQTPITLRITQASNGVLSGTMIDVGTTSPISIQGFYIPSVRRIVFVRIPANSSIPFQFYEGWITPNGLRIGGEFKVWRPQDGASANGVDFNFTATKVSDFATP